MGQYQFENRRVLIVLTGLVINVIWLLLWGITAAGTYSEANSLKAFYYDTAPTYQTQICREGLVLDNAALGDVRGYNASLRGLRAWDSLPLIGWGIVGPDDELRPVNLEACP